MEGMVKGYLILTSGKFISEDATLRARMPAEIHETIADHAATIKPREWYPRGGAILLWRAIAAAGDDEATVNDSLIRCGEYIANYATGTFLKLLLKLLTPRMFARKFPDLWAHDHDRGVAEVKSLDDTRMLIVFNDIEGFDHVSVTAQGFIRFALRASGLKSVSTRCPDWSLTTPGPREANVEVTWQQNEATVKPAS